MKKEIPELNLQCERVFLEKSEVRTKRGMSFVELDQKIRKSQKRLQGGEELRKREVQIETSKSKDSLKEDIAANSEESELKRIEKLEQMIENLNGSVKSMNEELKMLKNSIYRKRNLHPENSDKGQKQKSGIDFDLINKTITANKSEKPSVLKMKTFNDLQLDLSNLIKTDKKKENNGDFLNENSNIDENSQSTFKKDDAEKLYELINKLKNEKN